MVKLFVGGFPLKITEMELAMLIAPHGNIVMNMIIHDKADQKMQRVCFRRSSDRGECEKIGN